MAPAQHPQAKFDPIPPDLDLHTLVERTPNFHWVLRISAAQIRTIGPQEFEKLVFLHLVHGGKPLVIEKWNDRLPKSLFSAQWLEATYNKKAENVRDLVGQTDIPMTIGHYLRSMKTLTNQWTPHNFRDERRQRLYLKDIDCPPEWRDHLQKVIPPNLFYMNENVDERPGKGRSDDLDLFQEGRSPAPAGDLMSSLPEEMRAQNLMCYIGHEGTYTPAHREMCASLGQNIMVDASGDENGEKPGSSIWFMTETKDREVVREYFLSMLGHDIEIEKHFAQINAWKKATVPVYIVEQKAGDFVLVPPLAPHQVWNRGTRTIKVAWNRTTAETLQLALHEALPKARLVCRDEQYKNKAIVFYTLDKYYKEMVDMEKTADIGLLGFGQDLIKSSTRMKQMAADFKALFRLYTEVLVDEMFATKEKDVDYIEYDSNITCSYCRANIFNRFLTCKHCVRQLVNGDEDTYDICMECYAMGRSCFCVANLSWCEQWHWSDLVDRYEAWRALIIKNDGYISFDSSPLPLELARRRAGKKSVAQICQEQLRKRPWNDITQVREAPEPLESDIEVDDDGRPKKKKKKRKAKKGDVYRCHVCQHKDYTYKLAFCTNQGCTDAYCYGVLYRAFDLLPQEVMQNERWQCPKCLHICNCAACRRAGNGNPYIPKTTLLGHDTRRVADDRSVETLVDFRAHNLGWLNKVGDESRSLSSKRMQRLQQAAEAEKAKQAELANQVPALPDGTLAERMDDATQQQQAGANGIGRQDGAPGSAPVAAPMGEVGVESTVLDCHQENGGPVGPAEVADMSLAVSQDQSSSYPDPSVLGRERMLGMGYYEQDDSPDKILFDPYQMPSADAMAAVDDEPEMSEYLKKQLRIAKRRARQEEDNDPDFRVPRSHHRKRPKLDHEPQRDAQEIALSNMDPALFGGDVAMTEAPADEDRPTEPEASAAPAEVAQAEPEPEERVEDATEPRPYSPNRPALRHARPKISYIEDENGDEDFDDLVITRSPKAPKVAAESNTEYASKDPLDLASAAIFSMTGANGPAAPAPSAPEAPPKKRGPGRPRKSEAPEALSASAELEVTDRPVKRGPGRPLKSDVAGDSSVIPSPKATTAKPEPAQRRRGRAPRTRGSLGVRSEDGDLSGADVDAQLAQQLDAFDDDGELLNAEPTVTTSNEPVEPAVPRRRGRPPLNAKPRETAKRTEVAVELPTQAPLSIADRMRLKGRKFRIGQRKSSGTPKSAKEDGSGEAERRPTPKPPRPAEAAVPEQSGRGRGRSRKHDARDATRSADEDFDPAAAEEPVSDEALSPSPSLPIHNGMDSLAPSVPGSAPAIAHPAVPPEPSPPSHSAAVSSPTPEPSGPAPAEQTQSLTESPSRSPSPPPTVLPRLPGGGPTIVRLLDSDEEEEADEYHDGSAYASEDSSDEDAGASDATEARPLGSEDDDDDDGDEDIPARVGQAFSSAGRRGGMVARGRGGFRGRGRGRGRGRARGRGRGGGRG